MSAAIADRRLHPGTILLRFLKEAPGAVLAVPAGVAFASRGGFTRIFALVAVMTAVVVFSKWLAWRRFRYVVGASEIVVESGIFSRNRRTIPFDRVQDVDIERTFLARVFGLARVRIETGAGGRDEGLLDSVTLAEAQRLREIVRAFHAVAPQAEAAVETAPEGRLLYAMGVPRLLLFGLFSFSLMYIAGFFALLQTFDGLLPFDIYDPARWMGLIGDYLPERFTAAAIAIVLFLAVLLGLIAGVVRTAARDFGFRLVLEGGRFRREHGLFTRREAVIPRRRVQLAAVDTGPVRNAFGWSGLSFQTLGSGGERSGRQAAAPFAERDEVAAILAEAGAYRLPPPPELATVSRRHILRSLVGKLLPLAALILAGSLWRPQLLFLLLFLPLLAIGVAVERRFHRYALDGELLFVARGAWRQRLWLVPVANVQALSLSRGPLQRRLGLATLSVDTAGAPVVRAPRIVDLREADAEALAARISAYASGRKSGTER
ncbi:MAG TPA: PH domain-containing protein [Allosphingosinicella sp.]|nr:PH domain-containing protein [Allosphingosinicella sp.]